MRAKLVRDLQLDLEAMLRDAGVKRWDVIRTRRGHWRLEFYRDGKPQTIPFCGSGDWRAAKNNIARAKRILSGAAQ